MTKEIKRRLETEVDGSVPLKDRLDLGRLKKALEEPLYMGLFLVAEGDDMICVNIPHENYNSCGTIGCIAGNTVLNEFPKNQRTVANVDKLPVDVETAARRILGLTNNEANQLFFLVYPTETPGTKEYAEVLTKAVQAWCVDYGVPWV